MTKTNNRFWDPTGARYGTPTYPWRMAPTYLATRRQLTARELRPGGQDPVAQVMWRSRRAGGVAVAYLYDTRLALRKRTATPAQLAALDKANRARRACPKCGQDTGSVFPARQDACLDCADPIAA